MLGAHPRTINLLTGLSSKANAAYDSEHPAPRGRPIALDRFVQEFPLPVQAALRAFAIEYVALMEQDFSPVICLITAYRFYLSFGGQPRFSFDEAFIVAARLSGNWIATHRELEVASCSACECNHLRRTGTVSSSCPFCRCGTNGGLAALGLPLANVSHSKQARTRRCLAAPAPEIERRITAYQLRAMGANAHVATMLTSRSAQPIAFPKKRGLPLLRWSSLVGSGVRAKLAVAVMTFRRLREAAIDDADAMVAAYRHASPILPRVSLDFNDAFRTVALSEALWGVEAPALELVDCSQCSSTYLASRCESARRCPFCELMGKRRRNRPAEGRLSG